MALALIPIAIIILYLATAGSAQISAMTAKAHVGWLSGALSTFLLPEKLLIQYATKLAKYIASYLEPSFLFAESRVAGWISGIGQALGWNATHAHRNSSAIYNTAKWADTKLRSEIADDVLAKSKGQTTTIIRTTAPSVTIRRITTKDSEIALRNAITADAPGVIAHSFPKVKWDAAKWRKYLGIAATGTISLPFPRVLPFPGTIPKVQEKVNKSDSKRLSRLEKLLGITGLSALIGATFGKEIERFLKCGNTRGIAKAWCGANLSQLLGLLGGLAAITEGFGLVDFAKLVQSGISDGEGLVANFWQVDLTVATHDRQLGSAS